MARPPYLLRRISYRQNESAGNPIPTASLDSEFNDTQEVVNQINRLLRGITDASGRLVNVAAKIAESLVGTDRFDVAAPTTVFTTDITWDSSFSNGNVQVIANGVVIDQDDVSVADSGGFLEVTLVDSVDSGWVLVAAYSQGAGIATLLSSTDVNEGASQIGVADVDGNFSSTNVEGALAELADEITALLAALGTLSKIWTSDGTTVDGDPATGNYQGGGFRLVDLADAIDPTDAVTLQQLQAVTQNLDTLLSLFIRSDGATPFTGDQSMGGHKITDLGEPTDNSDAATKLYVDTAVSGSEEGSLALEGLKDSALRGTLTGGVTMGQDAADTADSDQTTNPTAVLVPTLCGLAKPSANDQVTNKLYVDESIDAALGGFPLGGCGADGTGLGSPVATLTAGVYHFESLTVSAPQTLTGPVTIFCDGPVNITAALTSSYSIRIFSTDDVLLGVVTCRGLEVRSSGDVTLGGAVTANSGLVPAYEDYTNTDEIPALGIFRVSCLGGFFDGGNAIIANDILIDAGANSTVSATWTSTWAGSGGAAQTIGTAWPNQYGNSSTSGGAGSATDAAGGGGGTGGGAGGASDAGAVGGAADPYNASRRCYLVAFLLLRRGSGGGGSTSNVGGKGGGRISFYCGGNLVATGAIFVADGADGVSGGGTNDSGGGGAGPVRIVARGTITGGTIHADGGDGGSANGGGGGGGSAFFAATAFAGLQTITVLGGVALGGGGVDGGAGVSGSDTFTAAQIDDLVAEGLFAA